MPRYIIERILPKMSQEEMGDLGSLSVAAAKGIPGVVWIKSYISEAEGKTYCEYEAPNPEALLEHARRIGLETVSITLINAEINPNMFR